MKPAFFMILMVRAIIIFFVVKIPIPLQFHQCVIANPGPYRHIIGYCVCRFFFVIESRLIDIKNLLAQKGVAAGLAGGSSIISTSSSTTINKVISSSQTTGEDEDEVIIKW